jgi:hypothetical protein
MFRWKPNKILNYLKIFLPQGSGPIEIMFGLFVSEVTLALGLGRENCFSPSLYRPIFNYILRMIKLRGYRRKFCGRSAYHIKRTECRPLDVCGSAEAPLSGFCEHGNEISGSI